MYVEMLVGQISSGGSWALDIYGKELSTLVLPRRLTVFLKGFQCSDSSIVPIYWLYGSGEAESLVLHAAGAQSSLLCTSFGCMTCRFGMSFLKSNSASCQTR